MAVQKCGDLSEKGAGMGYFWSAGTARRTLWPLLLVAVLASTVVGARAEAPVQGQGLELTISGPAFSAPARFVVPADNAKLILQLASGSFKMMALLDSPVASHDGKHRLKSFTLGAEPAGVGTYTESSGLTAMGFALTTDAGTPAQQNFSVSFKYQRGTTLPARIVIERYEPERQASGTLLGKAQRTNPQRKDQIYEISGRFDVRR